MLVSLFKLADVGPSLTNMVTNEAVSFEQEVIEKFEFSGAMTYSLVFQGTVDLKEISSELYGPFPFAFSNGFVQYAFSFIVDDPDMKDERMKKKTIGLLLFLVPEMISKIDDFREELEKNLVYKFHTVKEINQVDDDFLLEIVEEYNEIVSELLNETQANLLFSQLKELINQGLTSIEDKKEIALIYPEKEKEKFRNSFANLQLSIPFTEVEYKEQEAYIKTNSFVLSFKTYNNTDKPYLESKDSLLFLLDIMSEDYDNVYNIIKKINHKPKIGLIVSLSKDLEESSTKYGEFFIELQPYIEDLAFFSSSYYTTKEFKAKLLEALFWSLIP